MPQLPQTIVEMRLNQGFVDKMQCCWRNSLGSGSAVGGGESGRQKKGSNRKKSDRRAKRAERYPWEGERAAEPGDMPLMPLFHDTRFWHHALIGQMSSC